MRKTMTLLLSLMLAGALLPTNLALSAEKTGTMTVKKSVKRLPPGDITILTNTAVALTAGECTALGGTVHDFTICNSGKACGRRDENGKLHSVCLSAQQ